MADTPLNPEALRKEAQMWLDRIDLSGKQEKLWLDDADKAVKAYTGEGDATSDGARVGAGTYDFNILFSNVETIVPAIINSAPAPDIRRRFGQDDPVARDFAEILERTMRVQVDDGRLQVEMEGMAQDGFLAGRGVIRLRFKSEFEPIPDDKSELRELSDADEPGDDALDENPNDAPQETYKNEQICFEAVSWRDFRRGPAKRWADVPWIAFRVVIADDDLETFADPELSKVQTEAGDRDRHEGSANDIVVWEVWDKKKREVVFVDEDKKRVLKRVPDPLGLTKFFPIADPVQAIEVTGRLMPVNPFSIYKKLAEELETVTKRIRAITKQLKVKGWYSGSASDLNNVLQADDNEFVPISEGELFAAHGGIEKAIGFWPVERLIIVLKECYALREQTKQAIYEITGISDIVRGASRSSETATAQQIKTQWGSLRIQKMQRQMERAARDIFVMMAEIIPAKFTPQTLEKITGISILPTQEEQTPVPPPPPPAMPGMQPQSPEQAQQMAEQAQQAQQQYQAAVQQAQEAEQARQAKLAHKMQLMALMQEKAATYFRIDVETDSTVRADLTRQKQEATEFMGAASGYFQAVAPMVQQGALTMTVALEIFGSFSRLFNLGKTVEDALDELIQEANKRAKQAQQPQQPQGPSPEQVKAEAEAKAATEEHQVKMQSMQAENQYKAQKNTLDLQRTDLDNKAAVADLTAKQARAEAEKINLSMKRAEAAGFFGVPLQPQPVPPMVNGVAQ